ncbi:MAG: DUF3016 domain-containing protein [Opitutae bacterium]|nr:DUF3016 domain-containing protein [Opitutae bacterium]
MKTIASLLLFAAWVSVSGTVTWAATAKPAAEAKPAPRVTVVFDHPENFTDVKQDFVGTERGRDDNLAMIRSFLEERGEELLPAGQKLTLTFTDIDLAGDYNEWRGPSWQDVRVVKDLYPPRFVFTFKLIDADGRVLKQDKVDLLDMAFMMRRTTGQQESLHYEKDILGDWLRATVKPPKK